MNVAKTSTASDAPKGNGGGRNFTDAVDDAATTTPQDDASRRGPAHKLRAEARAPSGTAEKPTASRERARMAGEERTSTAGASADDAAPAPGASATDGTASRTTDAGEAKDAGKAETSPPGTTGAGTFGDRIAEAGRDYAAAAATPEGRDRLSAALTGSREADLAPAQRAAVGDFLDGLAANGAEPVDVRGGDVVSTAAIRDGGGIGDALPPGVLGVTARRGDGEPVVVLRNGLSGPALAATAREEAGEALSLRARSAGIDVAAGDAGARLSRALGGETVTRAREPDAFRPAPDDTAFITLGGKRVEGSARSDTELLKHLKVVNANLRLEAGIDSRGPYIDGGLGGEDRVVSTKDLRRITREVEEDGKSVYSKDLTNLSTRNATKVATRDDPVYAAAKALSTTYLSDWNRISGDGKMDSEELIAGIEETRRKIPAPPPAPAPAPAPSPVPGPRPSVPDSTAAQRVAAWNDSRRADSLGALSALASYDRVGSPTSADRARGQAVLARAAGILEQGGFDRNIFDGNKSLRDMTPRQTLAAVYAVAGALSENGTAPAGAFGFLNSVRTTARLERSVVSFVDTAERNPFTAKSINAFTDAHDMRVSSNAGRNIEAVSSLARAMGDYEYLGRVIDRKPGFETPVSQGTLDASKARYEAFLSERIGGRGPSDALARTKQTVSLLLGSPQGGNPIALADAAVKLFNTEPKEFGPDSRRSIVAAAVVDTLKTKKGGPEAASIVAASNPGIIAHGLNQLSRMNQAADGIRIVGDTLFNNAARSYDQIADFFDAVDNANAGDRYVSAGKNATLRRDLLQDGNSPAAAKQNAAVIERMNPRGATEILLRMSSDSRAGHILGYTEARTRGAVLGQVSDAKAQAWLNAKHPLTDVFRADDSRAIDQAERAVREGTKTRAEAARDVFRRIMNAVPGTDDFEARAADIADAAGRSLGWARNYITSTSNVLYDAYSDPAAMARKGADFIANAGSFIPDLVSQIGQQLNAEGDTDIKALASRLEDEFGLDVANIGRFDIGVSSNIQIRLKAAFPGLGPVTPEGQVIISIPLGKVDTNNARINFAGGINSFDLKLRVGGSANLPGPLRASLEGAADFVWKFTSDSKVSKRPRLDAFKISSFGEYSLSGRAGAIGGVFTNAVRAQMAAAGIVEGDTVPYLARASDGFRQADQTIDAYAAAERGAIARQGEARQVALAQARRLFPPGTPDNAPEVQQFVQFYMNRVFIAAGGQPDPTAPPRSRLGEIKDTAGADGILFDLMWLNPNAVPNADGTAKKFDPAAPLGIGGRKPDVLAVGIYPFIQVSANTPTFPYRGQVAVDGLARVILQAGITVGGSIGLSENGRRAVA